MGVYHEVEPDSLESTLLHGLKQGHKGSKSDDPLISKTDSFLDAHCLGHLKKQGLNRQANIYAYLEHNGNVTLITNGESKPLDSFIHESPLPILELRVDPHKTFVSDLDTYDALKEAIENHKGQGVLSKLAQSYWEKIIPLDNYTPGAIRRPEVVITYNIEPQDIRHAGY